MIQSLRMRTETKHVEWMLHALIWTSLFAYIWHTANTLGPFRKQEGSIYWPLLWSAGFNVALFYGNASGLVPWLFYKQRYKTYVVWSLLLYAAAVLGNAVFDHRYSLSLFSTEKEPLGSDIVQNIQSKTVLFSLSLGYGLTKQWFENQKLQQQVIKAALTTQLKYLKAQINPHFLFNTLNMAYASATKSNDLVTADIIEKLSGLMRYVLYESNEDTVSLEEEIRYLDDFVSLQRQRLSPELASRVQYRVEGNRQRHTVAPLILIPFIENVFKHGILLSRRSDVLISIMISEKSLTLETKNEKSRHARPAEPNSGIGLNNVRERLLLLYPDQHTLDIDDSESSFHVRLQLELTPKP
ncbi:sensor histidine kinase [Hymenobacter guriensis]|uniref:Histidine kinase n=1 Tax=Hymenobacter guriensis TaxID=2793065 RepID=A0ABS0L7P2_9BACT|nr:histidine kinase [Hymenobacter guriensis]MBG8556122.1 histidine kinase [Hymenobacter guriensis]